MRPTSRTEFRRFARHREDVTTELYAAVDKSAPGRASRRHLIRYLDEQYGTEADQERDPIITDQWEMRHGDFTQELATLPDESVDLIVTDPPYPKKDLPLYGQLAETAARVLKPRGILFTYAGNIFLPEVQQLLGQHLNYGWTFCLLMGQGSDSRIMGRHLRQKWKPVLAYTPHQWPSGEWGDDLLLSGPTEKDLYGWQQTTGPAERLIEHYSPLNGLILDPFAGAASFGVAALTMGRRFVGVELDADRYDLACRRLEIESPIST